MSQINGQLEGETKALVRIEYGDLTVTEDEARRIIENIHPDFSTRVLKLTSFSRHVLGYLWVGYCDVRDVYYRVRFKQGATEAGPLAFAEEDEVLLTRVKRFERTVYDYITQEEYDAIMASDDRNKATEA